MEIKNVKEIQELLEAVAAADVTDFELKFGDISLRIKKEKQAPETPAAPQIRSDSQVLPAAPGPGLAAAAPAPPAMDSPQTGGEPEPTGVEVCSPMVGTFYQAPSPDSPPFVNVGDVVEPGQTLCIIEAMKLMNEIEAEQRGKVIKVLVESGQAVEFGQPLFLLEPLS